MNPSVIALVYASLLLFSPLAAAIPLGGLPAPSTHDVILDSLPLIPTPTIPSTTPSSSTTDLLISFQALSSGGAVCRFSELSPSEVQRFKDSILTPGLIGDEISAGTAPNTDRDTVSDRNTLLVPNPFDDETAFQKQIPTEILAPNELAPLQNNRIKGPFAFGISLYDSLRAARCVTEEKCAIVGEQLQFRNSGTGIKGAVKNLYNAVWKDVNSTTTSFTDEEADYLRAQIEAEQTLDTPDANQFRVSTFEREKSEQLMNHIRVDNNWKAGMLTNCDDGKCIMALYSMFDKYFNSWYSGDLVIGTFTPTIYGQFKRMLVRSKRFSTIPGTWPDKVNLVKKWQDGRISERLRSAGDTPIKPSDFFQLSPSVSQKELDIPGIERLRNFKKRLSEESDFRDVTNEFFAGKNPAAIKSGGYNLWEGPAFGPDGKMTKIVDLEKRQRIFTYVGKVKEYADITSGINKKAQDLIKESNRLLDLSRKAATQAEAQALIAQAAVVRTSAARQYAAIFRDFDDFLNLDMPELIRADVVNTSFHKMYFKSSNGEYLSISSSDGKFFDEFLDEFAEKGNFSGVTRAAHEAGNPNNLQLYRVVQEKDVGFLDPTALQRGDYLSEVQIRLNSGLIIQASPSSWPQVQQDMAAHGGALPKLVKAGFEPDRPLTPELFSENILVGDIWPKKVGTFSRNVNSLQDTMIARDWGKRHYTNWLSKQLQTNEKLLTNYLNVLSPDVLNSGVGITFKTYFYWWGTTGFGNDTYSLYRLPREWSEVEFEPGDSEFYHDAYIDFFSHEGSDTGDLFQNFISHVGWPVVLNEAAQQSETLKSVWDYVNQSKGRKVPENLAMFMFGAQSCPDCQAHLVSPTDNRLDVQYVSPESVNGFFLEHQKTREAKEEGQVLVTFAHHANVKGQIKGEQLEEINLVKARQDEVTCEQQTQDVFLLGSLAKVIGEEKVGGVLAAGESLAYVGGGMMGVGFTIMSQFLIAPQLSECVDDKEGYYSSMYIPVNDDDDRPGDTPGTNMGKKVNNVEKDVAQEALDGIREFTNFVDQNRNNASLTDNALHESTSEVRELIDDAQKDDVAEAELRVTGSSSGYMRSEEVMYFWGGGGSLIEPTLYDTEGKTVVTTADGHTIALDNDSGTLTVDGQVVIDADHADHERLSNKNLAIPALEIPQRLNGFALGDSNALLFTVNVRGDALVHDPFLLDCLQQAVFDQTGVPLNSNLMNEAFGQTDSIVTNVYPNISVDRIHDRILMGGQLPQTAIGPAASINVYGSRDVIVTNASNPEAGKFQSGLWENGSVIYKPQTNELLIWLRHHAQAVVSDQDVKDFSGTLTTTTNPLTACEEPAIDLSVETDSATAGTKLKGDNLTAGLKKNGPFQVFETETKRFILYSKLVDGECKDFFKVIDKETGEVYDQEITDISQDEDGTIHIKTADGQDHSLQFSDENGKPVLTYDGQSELLRSASGKGGSFYYDPNKGLYFAENAQLVPLNDNFKNQGIAFQANPDGTVSGKAADNVFVINPTQGSEGLFNIPSLPENVMALAGVLLVLLMVTTALYLDSTRRRKKEGDAHDETWPHSK